MRKYILLCVLCRILVSCNEVTMSPIDKDTEAPGKVTNVVIESIPGGAFIKYDLPNDPDLLYVKVVYKLDNGTLQTVNASCLDRSLKVEGFAEVKEYELFVTCVDRSGNESEAVVVKFLPQTPPVISVKETINISPDFGGLNLTWDNETESPLAIIISQKESDSDEYKIIDTYYTSVKDGNYTSRGLESIESEFKIKVRDKWGNYSDEINTKLTPLYEERLDRKNFKALGVEYTNNVTDYGNLVKLWDEDYENNIFGGTKVPWYASFDMGVKARLSRIVLWQYSWASYDYAHYYAGSNMRKCRIYGSNDPTLDMSGWILLMECEIMKPSGLPIGIGRQYQSDEDFDIAHNKGHEFMIPLDAPAVRYLRIEGTESWEGNGLGVPGEMHIFGDAR